MASVEYKVLTEIFNSGTLSAAVRAGIKAEHFKDGEARRIFKYIENHYYKLETRGEIPLLQDVQSRWPSFELAHLKKGESGNIKTLAAHMKMGSMGSDVRSYIRYMDEVCEEEEKSPMDVLKIAREQLSNLESKYARSCESFGLDDVIDHVRASYYRAQEGKAYGVPWPWDCLTEDTLGKNPGHLYIIYGRMKAMKCVCEGQRIMMPSGELKAIEDIPETCSVPSYTESTKRVRTAAARRVSSGSKPSVEVVTKSGLRLRTGNKHLYMVPGGKYERIKNLKPGDYIATSRRTPSWMPTSNIEPDTAHMLGLLVGDGNYTRSEVQFTNKDPEVMTVIQEHADSMGCSINQCSRPIEYRIVGKGYRNPLLDLLRGLGIHGQKRSQKRAPEEIFRSSPDAIGAFLAGLIDSDGTVGSKFVGISSSSRELLLDVQHLLMRFGIRGRLKEVYTNYDTLAYQLYIYSKENAKPLVEHVAKWMCLTYKREALERLARRDINDKRNVDAVPYTDELKSLILQAKGGRPWPRTGVSKFNVGKLFTKTGTISRKFLNKLADQFESEALRAEANTDIIWEKINTIEDIGMQECYDICIEDGQDPNFVVEGFIVHNTWLLLKCAVEDFVKYNQRVVIWSKEMPEDQMKLRLGSLIGDVDYQLQKAGALPPRMEKKLFNRLDEFSVTFRKKGETIQEEADIVRRKLIVLCGRNAPRSIEELQTIIKNEGATAAYIDGFYHITCDRAERTTQLWARYHHISEAMKNLSIEEEVPVIATAQANREGEKVLGRNLTEVAGTDSLAREADLIMRAIMKKGRDLEEEDYEGAAGETHGRQVKGLRGAREPKSKYRRREKSGNKKSKRRARTSAEIALVLSGNRDGTLDAFSIHAVPGYNFNVISTEFSAESIQAWVKRDTEDMERDEKKQKNKHKRGRKNDEEPAVKGSFNKFKEPR